MYNIDPDDVLLAISTKTFVALSSMVMDILVITILKGLDLDYSISPTTYQIFYFNHEPLIV